MRQKEAFSLIEVLLVMGIIAVVTTMGISASKRSVDKAYNYYWYTGYSTLCDATMDAVLLFLSLDSRGQSISLNDFPKNAVNVMSEGQRLIYVACSRPKQFLAIAIPSVITEAQIRQKLGMAVKIFTIN